MVSKFQTYLLAETLYIAFPGRSHDIVIVERASNFDPHHCLSAFDGEMFDVGQLDLKESRENMFAYCNICSKVLKKLA